jgi:uncharacterized membrane protein
MNTAGSVDENKSQEMTTKIFKPMKVLMRKHNCAMRFVHHMGKGGEDRRGGQRMLGGTANHAWAEDSLYISRGKKTGEIVLEFESKSAPEQLYTITGLDNHAWTPIFEPKAKPAEPVPTTGGRSRSTQKAAVTDANHPVLEIIRQGGSWTTRDLSNATGRPYNSLYRTLQRMEEQGAVARAGKAWRIP